MSSQEKNCCSFLMVRSGPDSFCSTPEPGNTGGSSSRSLIINGVVECSDKEIIIIIITIIMICYYYNILSIRWSSFVIIFVVIIIIIWLCLTLFIIISELFCYVMTLLTPMHSGTNDRSSWTKIFYGSIL